MFDDSFDSNIDSSFTQSQNIRQTPAMSNSFNKQTPRTGSARTPLATVTGSALNSGNSDSNNSVVCNCGNDAVLLTVRKEGPNTGI